MAAEESRVAVGGLVGCVRRIGNDVLVLSVVRERPRWRVWGALGAIAALLGPVRALPLVLCGLALALLQEVVEERVCVVRGVGVQFEARRRFGRFARRRYEPLTALGPLVVNEAWHFNHIVTYLAFIAPEGGGTGLVCLFEYFLPRLGIVRQFHAALSSCDFLQPAPLKASE